MIVQLLMALAPRNGIDSIHFEGDSITDSSFLTNPNLRYSSRFATAYPNIRVRNTAVSSSVITIGENSVKYRLDNSIPLADSDKAYFSCFIGINNLVGYTAQQSYDQLVVLWEDIISKGYKLIPWTLTAIADSYPQYMRDRVAPFNTLIKNGYSQYADFLMDADTIPGFDVYNSSVEPGLYYRDVIHPNENGHLFLFNKLKTILQSNNLI